MSTGSSHAADASVVDVDERDRRALTEYLTVLEDLGRARDANGLYLAVSQSGSEYLVDTREGRCECPDHEYRGGRCKHLRRVEFATGERPVPTWADREAIDEDLGQHVDGGPRLPATDGGEIVEAGDEGVILTEDDGAGGPDQLTGDAEAAAKAILEYYRDTCATHHRLGYVPALYVDAGELRVSRGGLIRYPDDDRYLRPSALLKDVPRFHEYTRPTWRDTGDWTALAADQLRETITAPDGETYAVDAEAIARALRDLTER